MLIASLALNLLLLYLLWRTWRRLRIKQARLSILCGMVPEPSYLGAKLHVHFCIREECFREHGTSDAVVQTILDELRETIIKDVAEFKAECPWKDIDRKDESCQT